MPYENVPPSAVVAVSRCDLTPRFYSSSGCDCVCGRDGDLALALLWSRQSSCAARFDEGGLASKIVAELKPGAKVSISRNDVDTVVTEFGVAELSGRFCQ